jgi:hypothetical protein
MLLHQQLLRQPRTPSGMVPAEEEQRPRAVEGARQLSSVAAVGIPRHLPRNESNEASVHICIPS